MLAAFLLLGAATACAGGTGPQATPTAEPPVVLRVATVNLLHGFFSDADAATLSDRLALVAETLRDEKVDLVGVQEASITSYGGDVAARLADLLEFDHVYHRANPNLAGFTDAQNEALVANLDFEEGSAVISRYPITESEALDLPRASDEESRIALRAAVETPAGAIDVYVTHLTNAPGDAANVAQAAALHDWIVGRPRDLPAVLLGDFNATEGSETAVLLTQSFVDAYRAFDAAGPGYSCCQDDLADPRPAAERKRIDYVFLIAGDTADWRVIDGRVILDEPFELPDGRSLWASDHFGVLAEVRIEP